MIESNPLRTGLLSVSAKRHQTATELEPTMAPNDDKHLDVCQNIEVGIKQEYDLNPLLSDSLCVFALDNAKIAIKQRFGFAQNENVSAVEAAQGIIEWCVTVGVERIDKVNGLTLKEYVTLIEKIKRSVERHAKSGHRGYYEFIRKFVP